jgi:hypothetical protein
MRIRERLEVSIPTQRRLAWLLEIGLVGMFFIGIDRGNLGIIVNSGVALLVAQLPPILKRDYEIPMDPGLTLWITAAVFLHALGTVGVPGSTFSFYATVWWYDHLTHTLSATLVAAIGYVLEDLVEHPLIPGVGHCRREFVVVDDIDIEHVRPRQEDVIDAGLFHPHEDFLLRVRVVPLLFGDFPG